ncbi:hypothetical protein HF086_001138, partial [Spodoptera exigua]
QKLETRGGRILALVPAHNAPSDDSEPSDIEDEIRVHAPLSMSSSSAPSIESSLERLNLLNDEQEPTNDNVRLTPIFQTVYSSPSLEPNCNKVPILSDIPSFPATPASPVTPATPTNSATASVLARSASLGLETPRMPANASSTLLFSRRTRSQRPAISVAQRPRRIQKFTLSYRWKKAVFRHLATMEEESDPIGDATIQTPLEYFYKFFSPDILTHILEQSNAYAVSKTGRTLGLTEDELRDFIAIHIIMGVVSMPSYTDYWSLRYRYKLVADLMPLKRYQQIRRYLHFVDNNIEDSDRYYKIRPLVQKIRENCLFQENERRFSIDEMMIPYKGTKAGKRRQYMKDKPNKWGFKNYVRAGVSGMIYDFILYGGEDTFRFHTFSEQEASIGFGAQVVIALCKTIKSKPAFVFCDNFFSCPELFYILREEYGIFGLGTIRNNRLRGAEASLPSEKEMKKKPRGSHAQATCNKNRLAVGLTKYQRSENGIKGTKKRVPQVSPVETSRYDNVGHFMTMTTQGRCRLCSKLTVVQCLKCQVRLCFVTGKNSRNCQLQYHVPT